MMAETGLRAQPRTRRMLGYWIALIVYDDARTLDGAFNTSDSRKKSK